MSGVYAKAMAVVREELGEVGANVCAAIGSWDDEAISEWRDIIESRLENDDSPFLELARRLLNDDEEWLIIAQMRVCGNEEK